MDHFVFQGQINSWRVGHDVGRGDGHGGGLCGHDCDPNESYREQCVQLFLGRFRGVHVHVRVHDVHDRVHVRVLDVHGDDDHGHRGLGVDDYFAPRQLSPLQLRPRPQQLRHS